MDTNLCYGLLNNRITIWRIKNTNADWDFNSIIYCNTFHK